MRVNKIKFTNFAVFEDETLDFRRFDQSKPILIIGDSDRDKFDSNGTGKSTVFKGIVKAVFGRDLGKKKNPIMHGKDSCNVKIWLEDKARKIIIDRKFSKSKPNGIIEKLKVDGVEIDLRKISDSQEYINNLFGTDYEYFLNTSMFGYKFSKLFAEAADTDRKKIIGSIKDLSIYDRCSKLSAIKLRKKEEDLIVLEAELSSLDDHVKSLEIVEDNQRMDEIDKLQKEKAILTEKHKESWNAHQELMKRKSISDKKYEKSNSEFGIIKLEVEKWKEKCSASKRNLSDKGNDLEEEKGVYDRLKEIYFHPEVSIGEICPFCKSKITADTIDDYKKHIKEEMKNVKIKIERLKDKIKELEIKYEKRKKKESNVLKEYEKKREEVDRLHRLCDSEHHDLLVLVELERERDQRISDLYGKILRLKEEKIKTSATKEIEKVNDKKLEIKKKIKKLNRWRGYYAFWKTGFISIKNSFINSIIEELEDRTNFYLNSFSGDTSVEVSGIKPLKSGEEREKIDIIVHRDGDVQTYEDESGGEERRIDIGFMLGFADVSSSIGGIDSKMFFADEIFDVIDKKGITNIMEFLNRLAAEGKLVCIITHNDWMKDYFDSRNVVTVVQRNKKSKIVYYEN